jgi:hypothetical protein
MPKYKYYTIPEACETVAESITDGSLDNSPTSIRCAINDLLDSYAKQGYRVRYDYNQTEAIKKVQKIAAQKCTC